MVWIVHVRIVLHTLLLTFSARAQEGYGSWVCLYVSLCVCDMSYCVVVVISGHELPLVMPPIKVYPQWHELMVPSFSAFTVYSTVV